MPLRVGVLNCRARLSTLLHAVAVYEFVVRAYGNGSTYDAKWGFWSETVTTDSSVYWPIILGV